MRGNKFRILRNAICVVLILLGIYWLYFEPILSLFIISDNSIYVGVHYYEDEHYLDFRKGPEFRAFLSTYQVAENSDVIYFSYANNHIRNNPIYGRVPNCYVLDAKCTPEVFAQQKGKAASEAVSVTVYDDYEVYLRSASLSSKGNMEAVAFHEQECIVRYILITDVTFEMHIADGIVRYAHAKWQKGTGGVE